MITKIHIISSLVLLLFTIGCTRLETGSIDSPIKASNEQQIMSKVSYSDIEAYLDSHGSRLTKGSTSDIIKINPLSNNNGDTLLYVVQYREGWVILSGDKRTPPVIAHSDSGELDFSPKNKAFLSWLNATAHDIDRVRNARDEELSFSCKEIESNISQWRQNRIETRFNPQDPIIDTTTYNPNHWVLVDSVKYNVVVYQVHHLLREHWSQDAPYNDYCPLDGNNNPYYVGCGGIAAGQMLHHLFRNNGYPSVFRGITMAGVGMNYIDYSNPSSVDSTQVTAHYLREINDEMGLTVLINYWQGGTFVLSGDIYNLFHDYGYFCSYSSFDVDIVRSRLLLNKPILALAFDEWILNLPDITEGHYFIIDGYERSRPVTEYHYVLTNGQSPVPNQERVEYEYGELFTSGVKMNWGWGTQWTSGTNDGFFALTGDWTTTNGSFNTSRHIFYDFD